MKKVNSARTRAVSFLLLLVIGATVAFVSGATTAEAASHPSGSSIVAFVGSEASMNGGGLFHSNAAFSGMTFSNLAPASVDATGLAPYDTVVLNVASSEMGCSVNTLSVASKAALVTWLGQGNKLLIYDSECPTQDYSWLPFPFTTQNPGQLGANGTLTIVEDDSLGSNNTLSPFYIDANAISTQTDAIGDANVLVSQDPNLFVHETALNATNFQGPVHVYAQYKPAADEGLFIYNGFDVDFMGTTPDNTSGPNAMNKQFLLELQQPFNPATGLSHSVSVAGITLNPPDATNPAGTSHTVTAKVADTAGTPQPGKTVSFVFEAGSVNNGAGGTCSPNADCTTDANGIVNFTYPDTNGVGDDQLKACFDNGSVSATTVVCSADVAKHWVAGASNTSLMCTRFIASSGLPYLKCTASDPEGVKKIQNTDTTDKTITKTAVSCKPTPRKSVVVTFPENGHNHRLLVIDCLQHQTKFLVAPSGAVTML